MTEKNTESHGIPPEVAGRPGAMASAVEGHPPAARVAPRPPPHSRWRLAALISRAAPGKAGARKFFLEHVPLWHSTFFFVLQLR